MLMTNRENPFIPTGIPTGDIFSKRQKKFRGEISEVYVYNDFPNPLRHQVIYIWKDNFKSSTYEETEKNYKYIVEILCREYGVPELLKLEHPGRVYSTELEKFILNETDIEKIIDTVEVSFRHLESLTKLFYTSFSTSLFKRATEKLNHRFREHGIGYQYTDGKVIRVDSEFIHAEIVKPALILLDQPHYAGAQEEFLKAHEHYRKGNAKEALSECLKAFESVMKAICDKRDWQYDSKATAKPLVQACFKNGLIPPFWESHYSSLRSLLESVPTGRNKLSGHGQGTTPTTVSDHVVAYMLHMTASAIVFLAEADKKIR